MNKKHVALAVIVVFSITGLIVGGHFLYTHVNSQQETRFVRIDENQELAYVRYDFYSGRDLIYMNLMYVASNPTSETVVYSDPYLNAWVGDLWLTDAQLMIWLNVSSVRCQNGTYHVFWGLLSNGQDAYGFIFHQNNIWRYFVPIAHENVDAMHVYLSENAE